MSHLNTLKQKIYSLEDMVSTSKLWKQEGEKIVFTNGCFDLVHSAHITVLAKTADLGDKLIIGLNSDESIKKIKGKNRPIIKEGSRAFLLASLSFVDAVVLFSEENPYNLISKLLPDILAKGGDYQESEIAGSNIVRENGGEVIIIPFIDGFSSTNIIEQIKNS